MIGALFSLVSWSWNGLALQELLVGATVVLFIFDYIMKYANEFPSFLHSLCGFSNMQKLYHNFNTFHSLLFETN